VLAAAGSRTILGSDTRAVGGEAALGNERNVRAGDNVLTPEFIKENAMKLLTLQRQAPVAPGATNCDLCDTPIAGIVQDHILAGQPGTALLQAAICQSCGEALARVADRFGPDMCVLVLERGPAVESLVGGPALRTIRAANSSRSIAAARTFRRGSRPDRRPR
jgi:hypothetical protein